MPNRVGRIGCSFMPTRVSICPDRLWPCGPNVGSQDAKKSTDSLWKSSLRHETMKGWLAVGRHPRPLIGQDVWSRRVDDGRRAKA